MDPLQSLNSIPASTVVHGVISQRSTSEWGSYEHNRKYGLWYDLWYDPAHILPVCLTEIRTSHPHWSTMIMITSSNGNIFRITGPLYGEFTGHRWIPVTKASDAELWCLLLRLNNGLSKQSRCWWFKTPSCSLWHYCNDRIKELCTSMFHTCTIDSLLDLRQVRK